MGGLCFRELVEEVGVDKNLHDINIITETLHRLRSECMVLLIFYSVVRSYHLDPALCLSPSAPPDIRQTS